MTFAVKGSMMMMMTRARKAFLPDKLGREEFREKHLEGAIILGKGGGRICLKCFGAWSAACSVIVRFVRCPVPGCKNSKPITAKDLEDHKEMRRYIHKKKKPPQPSTSASTSAGE